MEGGAVGHTFERDPPRDHPCQVWFNLVQRFQRTRFKCDLSSKYAEKRGDEIKKKSSLRKLLSQSQPNFAEMILGWPPFKFVSGDPDFQPRWPSLPGLV
jgi:hypothetical protein